MSVTLWRCRECGKWSHAKRRPSAHKRWHHVDGEERFVGWFVWCGPFDRYEARPADDTPPPPLGGDGSMLGTEVSPSEKRLALGMAEPDHDPGEVPF